MTEFFKFRKFSYAQKGDLKVAPTLGDAIIGKIPMSYLNGRDNVAEAQKGDLKVAPTLGDAIIGKIPMSYLNGRDNVAEAFRLP